MIANIGSVSSRLSLCNAIEFVSSRLTPKASIKSIAKTLTSPSRWSKSRHCVARSFKFKVQHAVFLRPSPIGSVTFEENKAQQKRFSVVAQRQQKLWRSSSRRMRYERQFKTNKSSLPACISLCILIMFSFLPTCMLGSEKHKHRRDCEALEVPTQLRWSWKIKMKRKSSACRCKNVPRRS